MPPGPALIFFDREGFVTSTTRCCFVSTFQLGLTDAMQYSLPMPLFNCHSVNPVQSCMHRDQKKRLNGRLHAIPLLQLDNQVHEQ